MKKLILITLLLCQCMAPPSEEIQYTSVDLEDFGEELIELSGLPFDIVVSSEWHLVNTGFEQELWKNSEKQLAFQQNSTLLRIPDKAEVISSIDNPDITTFCLVQTCIIQMNKEGLFEVEILGSEGRDMLKRLR